VCQLSNKLRGQVDAQARQSLYHYATIGVLSLALIGLSSSGLGLLLLPAAPPAVGSANAVLAAIGGFGFRTATDGLKKLVS
jgi:hypothetical protein